MSSPPERTISSPRLQPVQDNGGFGQQPTTDPNMIAPPQQQQVIMQQAAPPAPPNNGLTIPGWVLQLIPIIALLAGAIMVFAQQRADVEQLKQGLVKIEEVQTTQTQQFVSKQIFDLKMIENEKYQAQMNARFDKLEGLINGLYDRLPAKQHEK